MGIEKLLNNKERHVEVVVKVEGYLYKRDTEELRKLASGESVPSIGDMPTISPEDDFTGEDLVQLYKVLAEKHLREKENEKGASSIGDTSTIRPQKGSPEDAPSVGDEITAVPEQGSA